MPDQPSTQRPVPTQTSDVTVGSSHRDLMEESPVSTTPAQPLEYDGIRALVTGGASGIGAATASALMGRGARVAVLDLNPDDAPAGAIALRCDVSDAAVVAEAVTSAAVQLDGIDVVINNAGIGAQGDVTANDDDEWARVLDVNVVAVARVVRAALPYLRRSAHAAVVNTSSIA